MKYNQPGTIFYREAQRMQREGAKKVQKAGTGLSETDVGGTAGTDGSAAGTRKRRRDGGDGGPESKVAKTGNGGDVATAASNTIQIDSDAVSRDAVLLLADPKALVVVAVAEVENVAPASPGCCCCCCCRRRHLLGALFCRGAFLRPSCRLVHPAAAVVVATAANANAAVLRLHNRRQACFRESCCL